MYNDYNGYNNAPQNGYGYGYAAQPSLTYNQYLTRTFRWMAFGLLITFGLAYLTAYSSLIYTVVNLYLPLTIAELDGNILDVALIPVTLKDTTLGELKTGDKVNLEFDMIGKYISRIMEARQ